MRDPAETRRDELIAIFQGSSLPEDHKEFLVEFVDEHFRHWPDMKKGLILTLGDSLDLVRADNDALYDEILRLMSAVHHVS